MKKYIQPGGLAVCILFLVLVVLYGQKVETVDGVRVVHNGKSGTWGNNPKVSLKLVQTIGDIDTNDENFAFHMPADVTVDKQGNIYILDSGNHRIQKFDPSGKYIATIGNKGQGPGEFYFPASLDIDSSGMIYVSDTQNQRIQILNPDGSDSETVTSSKAPFGITRIASSGEMVMGAGGTLLISPGGFDPDQKPENLVKILNLEGSIIKDFVKPFDYKDFLVNRMGNSFHFNIDKNDNVYVSFDYQNRIEKYSADGRLLWKADRKLNYSTDAPKKKGTMKGSSNRREIRMPEMNRCSNGIAVDDKGRVWVLTPNRLQKEEEKVQTNVSMTMDGGQRSMSMKPVGNVENRETDMFDIEVYAADGTMLGKIPLTHFVDDIRIVKNRLFLLDRMRGAQFFEYKIIEN